MARPASKLLKELGETPLTRIDLRIPHSPTPAYVVELLDKIDEMRASGSYDWADSTLRGIYDTVARMGHATEGQAQALRNILGARRGGADDEVEYGERPQRRKSSGGVYRSVR